jgi:hypothetical protein
VWGVFRVQGRKMALFVFGARSMIGNWEWLIHPFFQSIFGWVVANQGYPNIALCLPKSDRKNQRLV